MTHPIGDDDQNRDQAEQPTDPTAGHRIVVVGPDGETIGEVQPGPVSEDDDDQDIGSLVEQPAKVMRIGSMIKQLLDEVKEAPLDEASRARLREIHARSVKELEDGLAPELVEELNRLSLPFREDSTPTDAEIRIAQAQLVGWLEGLFHGIQTALFAQQVAARAQFDEMRRRAIGAGPGGVGGPGQAGHGPGHPGLPSGQDDPAGNRASGPYL